MFTKLLLFVAALIVLTEATTVLERPSLSNRGSKTLRERTTAYSFMRLMQDRKTVDRVRSITRDRKRMRRTRSFSGNILLRQKIQSGVKQNTDVFLAMRRLEPATDYTLQFINDATYDLDTCARSYTAGTPPTPDFTVIGSVTFTTD